MSACVELSVVQPVKTINYTEALTLDQRMTTKTALVTGASAGIGQELAREFAANGWDLFVVARRTDRLLALADELDSEYGTDVGVTSMDLSEPEVAEKLYDEVDEREITVDALVNNVGIGVHGSFHETPLERELDQVQLNTVLPVHLTKLFLPEMVERDDGMVVNVASMAGFQAGPFMAGYYASKAYLLSLSEALAEELRGTGVSVTALCPGPVKTEFQDRAGMEDSMVGARASNTPARVARAGYRGAMAGKSIVIPSRSMKLAYVLSTLTPRPLVRRAARRVNAER